MIRDYQGQDFGQVARFHADSGIDYRMPDLDSPLFPIKKVSEVNGQVVGALALRLCAETFLWLDRQRRPQEKLQTMKELQAAVLADAWKNGLDEIHAAIPPIGFDRRLKQLGWEPDRDGWVLWTRRTA